MLPTARCGKKAERVSFFRFTPFFLSFCLSFVLVVLVCKKERRIIFPFQTQKKDPEGKGDKLCIRNETERERERETYRD